MTLNLALKLAACVLLLIAVFVPHAGRNASRNPRSCPPEPAGKRDLLADGELPLVKAAK